MGENWSTIEHRNVSSLLDLYIFKKHGNKFQLISRTHEDMEPMLMMHTLLSGLFDSTPQNSLVKLGKNLVGIISDRPMSLGVGDPWRYDWYVTHLNENDYITIEYIEGGSEDTFQDESSPTHFAYEGTNSIYDDNSEIFQIFVRYKGDIPQYNSNREFITVKNDDYSIKWVFSKEKGYIKTNFSN